jgi:predicted DNA-binding transcriptional regulator YafY
LKDHPSGGLTMTMTLNNLEEVERWVLGFGGHATVVKPEELRERIGRIGRELAERCGAWYLINQKRMHAWQRITGWVVS